MFKYFLYTTIILSTSTYWCSSVFAETWLIYINQNYNYQIEYPATMKAPSSSYDSAMFSEGEYYDKWGILVHSKDDVVLDHLKSFGSQFEDRKSTEEKIEINGVSADLVTVTTKSFPNWYGRMVFIDHGDFIYQISNGAIKDDRFEDFYKSFKFVNKTIFPDIPSTHPKSQAIQYVKEQGIVEGYADGTYKPDSPINRAEFTKILIGASTHSSSVTGSNCFPDVQEQWFAGFVCTAKQHNIIAGHPDGTFHPGDNINTAEAAKILVHTFNLPIPPGLPSDPWYTSYITALSNADALPKSATNPSHLLTRGEMAEMMYKVSLSQS